MKKTFLTGALLAMAGIGILAGSASASLLLLGDSPSLKNVSANTTKSVPVNTIPDSVTATGEWMFTMDGNDSNQFTLLQTNINKWFADKGIDYSIDLVLYDKETPPGNDTLFQVDFTNLYYGTWTSSTPIEFYTVKGGDEFAVWWIEGKASSGYWTTEHLTNGGGQYPTVSHLSAYNAGDPVPEPATMLLFGTGLAGLAGIARRKKK